GCIPAPGAALPRCRRRRASGPRGAIRESGPCGSGRHWVGENGGNAQECVGPALRGSM
ncbi:MAG: hypothetical protein AVDCRST_MAG68-1106, partial [uncultured Gemmatimonadetes bacterium]